jgi:aryl-alcohol dehydrogenase-like predicted oxidoreductase
MKTVQLGSSDLFVTPICLGTMTFGEQVDEATAFEILDRSLAGGINFVDTAEMYAVPPRTETFNATEIIIGNWLAKRPGARQKLVIATKVAGPSRNMPWIRGGSPDLTGADIIAACDASLQRLKTDVIDLYQIHWPVRSVPMFGGLYYQPSETEGTPIHAQLEALGTLVRAGKVRAVGLSNETPYGVHEFVCLAEQHGLPRVATVQNSYSLLNRSVENALDETLHRLNVSLLAYSPLSFGLLTGKYDDTGLTGAGAPERARLTRYESTRQQRWGRPEALAAAQRYSGLARQHGLTATQLALAFCYTQWRVASTIIGVTSVAQLDEDLAAWGTGLSADVLQEIDKIRWEMRDPAI